MRKIQPTLQSQGYDNFDDLLKKSLPKTSNIITVGQENCDFTSPKTAADNSSSGDLIVVYPGNYDNGDNSILLKDGVNWKFLPGVTLSSVSADGTFKDNNVQCNLRFDGFPTIENTNGLDKRIILQHADSRLDGFYWEFIASVSYNLIGTIFKNTLGGNPTLQLIDGVYPELTLSGAFGSSSSKLHNLTNGYYENDKFSFINIVRATLNIISIKIFSSPNFDSIDTYQLSNTLVHLRVFP